MDPSDRCLNINYRIDSDQAERPACCGAANHLGRPTGAERTQTLYSAVLRTWDRHGHDPPLAAAQLDNHTWRHTARCDRLCSRGG